MKTRGEVLQAHIHFAQEGVNGGIVVFLCTNLGNNPSNEPVPECPSSPGKVKETIKPGHVLHPGNPGG